MRTAVIGIVVLVFALAGMGYWGWNNGRETAEKDAVIDELMQQIQIYRDREEKISTLEAQITVCRQRIKEAQALTEDWAAKYQEIVRRPPQIERVEVPVEVVREGMPCEEGLQALAMWIQREAQSGRIR